MTNTPVFVGLGMANDNLFQRRLRDPFTEVTRKTRRNFLAAALVGIVIVKVGLIPTKVSAFGIDFTQSNQNALLSLIALVTIYFGIMFVVYMLSELTAWQIAFRSQELERMQDEKKSVKVEDQSVMEWFMFRYRLTTRAAKLLFITRIFFEVGVSLLVGIYSVLQVLSAADVSALFEPNATVQLIPKSGAVHE